MDLISFALLFQMYEVAASAQNTERVKLVLFDGSHGYLHNGLYRDPSLPDILKWENITLITLNVSFQWPVKSLQYVYVFMPPLQEVCAVPVILERLLEKKKNLASF